MRTLPSDRDWMFSDRVPGFSAESAQIDESLAEAFEHWVRTETYRRTSLEAEFEALTAWWKRDTEDESSPVRIAMHEAYQRIIGMGPAVVPCILRDLQDTHDQWFWALRAITGIDPIQAEDRGYIHRMVGSWLQWGRRQGAI